MISKLFSGIVIILSGSIFWAAGQAEEFNSRKDRQQPDFHKNLPLIDQSRPEKFETATFGLG